MVLVIIVVVLLILWTSLAAWQSLSSKGCYEQMLSLYCYLLLPFLPLPFPHLQKTSTWLLFYIPIRISYYNLSNRCCCYCCCLDRFIITYKLIFYEDYFRCYCRNCRASKVALCPCWLSIFGDDLLVLEWVCKFTAIWLDSTHCSISTSWSICVCSIVITAALITDERHCDRH